MGAMERCCWRQPSVPVAARGVAVMSSCSCCCARCTAAVTVAAAAVPERRPLHGRFCCQCGCVQRGWVAACVQTNSSGCRGQQQVASEFAGCSSKKHRLARRGSTSVHMCRLQDGAFALIPISLADSFHLVM